MNLCRNPVWVENQKCYFGCGNCRCCRLNRRSEWTLRMTHEASRYNYKAVFVGLSYDEQHIPKHRTLVKRDIQLFFKSLRRKIDYYYKKEGLKAPKIKYYACGEYGPQTHRPHYHLIIYGLDMKFADMIYKTWNKCQPQGFHCSLVRTRRAYGYTAGYASKKLGTRYGKHFKEKYPNKCPEFQLQSLNLGSNFLDDPNNYDKETGMYRHGKEWRILPRYYRKKLNIDAKVYKNVIEEYHEKVYQKVIAAYGKEGMYISDKTLPLDSKITYAGRWVTAKFWSCLDLVRKHCDDILKDREKEWRNKAVALA